MMDCDNDDDNKDCCDERMTMMWYDLIVFIIMRRLVDIIYVR